MAQPLISSEPTTGCAVNRSSLARCAARPTYVKAGFEYGESLKWLEN
jgi:hypothetical protein